jgi:hypothetical protein
MARQMARDRLWCPCKNALAQCKALALGSVTRLHAEPNAQEERGRSEGPDGVSPGGCGRLSSKFTVNRCRPERIHGRASSVQRASEPTTRRGRGISGERERPRGSEVRVLRGRILHFGANIVMGDA